MAAVRMKTELGNFSYSDGYHDCKTTYYLYCDKCGSFGIKEYRTVKTWAEIALGIFLATFGGIVVWYLFDSTVFTIFSACFNLAFVLAFIVYDVLVTYSIYDKGNVYRCRKCRNTDITGDNVLNFQEEDVSVIDVPDRLTCKHYDYTYA